MREMTWTAMALAPAVPDLMALMSTESLGLSADLVADILYDYLS